MDDVIQSLHDRVELVKNDFLKFTEKDLAFKSSPIKWSKKEILGHLIDSAQNNLRRFIVGSYQEKAWVVYDQEAWVIASAYQSYDSKKLLNLWISLNEHLIVVLSNLPQDKYHVLTCCSADGQASATLQYVANDYIVHLDHHLNQIFNK
jgi:hypothetical protein